MNSRVVKTMSTSWVPLLRMESRAASRFLDTVTTKDYQEMAVLVTEFSQMIADLPDAENVTLVNEEAIKEARTLYDSMTKDQKGYVDPADVKKLEAAEERIKEIKGSTD